MSAFRSESEPDPKLACTIVPHAVPFLFVDRLLSMQPGRARVLRAVTRNDALLRGYETLPSTLVVEAVAQAAGVLIVETHGTKAAGALTAVDGFTFHGCIRSGDRMIVEVELRRTHPPFVSVAAKVFVAGEIRAQGKITLSQLSTS